MEADQIAQQAQDLVSRLRQLAEVVERASCPSELFAKREQLNAVVLSVRQLEKKSIQVPEELRRMKTALTVEVAEAEQAESARAFLRQELPQIIARLGGRKHGGIQWNDNPDHAREDHGIGLKDLIDGLLLKEGTRLIHRKKRGNQSQMHSGTVCADGKIEVEVNGNKKSFASPSAAAKALVGGSINGWDWWCAVLENGNEIQLSLLRLQFKSK